MAEFNSVELEQRELESRARKAIKGLAPRCKRILMYLVAERQAPTGAVCHHCSVGNISDAVEDMQATLRRNGLFIRNYLPKKLLRNKFGENTQQHIWELVGLDA